MNLTPDIALDQIEAEIAEGIDRTDRLTAEVARLQAQQTALRREAARNALTNGIPLPASHLPVVPGLVDLRRDRDEAHAAMKTLFRRKVDVIRMVLASRMMDDVIDWDDTASVDQMPGLVSLVRQVEATEQTASMTSADIARADRSMAFDIASRPGASALSARLGALHTRLRDAQDFQAERAADAKLRFRLGMSAS